MGSGGGTHYVQPSTPVETTIIRAEETVTPAVAQSVSQEAQKAQTMQADARSRMNGISGTYQRYRAAEAESNGKQAKLG